MDTDIIIISAAALMVGLAFGATINQFVRVGYMAKFFNRKEPTIGTVSIKDVSVEQPQQEPQQPQQEPQQPQQLTAEQQKALQEKVANLNRIYADYVNTYGEWYNFPNPNNEICSLLLGILTELKEIKKLQQELNKKVN